MPHLSTGGTFTSWTFNLGLRALDIVPVLEDSPAVELRTFAVWSYWTDEGLGLGFGTISGPEWLSVLVGVNLLAVTEYRFACYLGHVAVACGLIGCSWLLYSPVSGPASRVLYPRIAYMYMPRVLHWCYHGYAIHLAADAMMYPRLSTWLVRSTC